MTELRTGIDLVDINRVAELIEKFGNTFLRETWTAQEITECDANVDRLAARWAAKEATIKALHSGLEEISPTDIWVSTADSGVPELHLDGGAALKARQLGLSQWSVSLTHEQGFAAAVVVALGVD